MSDIYERIGPSYATVRRADPRIAESLWLALDDARSVLNVGAGSGSYEPEHLDVTAVEPSTTMRAQRHAGAAPCVSASAESLPFPDRSFDVVMAVCSDWFWRDQRAGFAEMHRVARKRVAVLTLDRSAAERFWLSREYLPRAHELWPEFRATLANFGPCKAIEVPIPADCTDGFFHAFWRRPDAYLDESIRAPMAVFARLDEQEAHSGLRRLESDLASSTWSERHASLLERDTLDLGYRILVSDV